MLLRMDDDPDLDCFVSLSSALQRALGTIASRKKSGPLARTERSAAGRVHHDEREEKRTRRDIRLPQGTRAGELLELA